jgi:hypothetical protein
MLLRTPRLARQARPRCRSWQRFMHPCSRAHMRARPGTGACPLLSICGRAVLLAVQSRVCVRACAQEQRCAAGVTLRAAACLAAACQRSTPPRPPLSCVPFPARGAAGMRRGDRDVRPAAAAALRAGDGERTGGSTPPATARADPPSVTRPCVEKSASAAVWDAACTWPNESVKTEALSATAHIAGRAPAGTTQREAGALRVSQTAAPSCAAPAIPSPSATAARPPPTGHPILCLLPT